MNQNYQNWFDDKGDTTLRLNYPLTKDSIVFDVGGYEGSFVEKINEKYGCYIYVFEPIPSYFLAIQAKFKAYPNIVVINAAIAEINGKSIMKVYGDKTGFFAEKGKPVVVNCITLDQAMIDLGVQEIDLLKLNIEGAEYTVLDYMIKKNLVEKCNDIQVQFHTCFPNYRYCYDVIKKDLLKTHIITYEYSYVWENYQRK